MQPSGPPPPVRPSGWWYLVPVALVVVGAILSVTALTRGFADAEDTALSASAAAPGEDQPLTFATTGGLTIAYTGPVIVYSASDQARLAEELAIEIVPAGGGEPLPLVPYDGFNLLEEEGQQYVPLLTVAIEEPGEYLLTSSHSPQIDRERSALVVSESPWQRLRSGAERSLAFLFGGVGLAIVVSMILARTRGRAKVAARAAGPPASGGGWGGPPAPGPGGAWGGPPASGPPAGSWGPPAAPGSPVVQGWPPPGPSGGAWR